MAEKKLVNRNIVITLGLLCLILVVTTVGTAIYYNNMNVTYSSMHTHVDSEFASLAAQLGTANDNISSLNNQLSTLQSELANKSAQSTDLQTQVSTLLANLNTKTQLFQPLKIIITRSNSISLILKYMIRQLNSQLLTPKSLTCRIK